MEKRILLSTVYKRHKDDVYDYFDANSSRIFFKFSIPRIESFGLRFIKQNVQEVEILEYPTWDEYVAKLKEKDWDVVGFSFYLNEIHEILEMTKFARKQGISEIWAGNYGALTTEIQNHFDRVFIGYSEDMIAKELGKKIPNGELIHPPLISYTAAHHGIKLNCQGYLFTNRGCNNRCDFCQTPTFCKKPTKIPLHSIDNVLKYYQRLGITEVIILDESFGCFKNHAEEVVNLLDKYGFYWFPMVRADYLGKRLDDWSKKGLIGALTGIESINQRILDSMGKKETVEEIVSVVKRLKQMNKFTVGYYMIGFEDETVNSILKDLKEVAKLRLDITQLCVITPLPCTPQWEKTEKKYGIFDKDWHHYNCKHLVWNHPRITPEEMRDILKKGFHITYPRKRIIETSYGFMSRYIQNRGLFDGTKYAIKHFIHANTFNYFPMQMRMLPNLCYNGISESAVSSKKAIPKYDVQPPVITH